VPLAEHARLDGTGQRRRVVEERIDAAGGVVGAGGVLEERAGTDGSVADAGGVASERASQRPETQAVTIVKDRSA